MTTNGEAIVWSEPIKDGTFRLQPGDIADAIAWFKEKTDQEPKLILLNVKNERFVKEVPEGIKVVCRGGVLAGEVWLSAVVDFVTPSSHIETQSDHGEKRRDKIDTRYILPAGRPALDLPIKKVQEFAAQGLGCRAISKKLKEGLGIVVSYRSIHRAIKKLQAELPIVEGNGNDL